MAEIQETEELLKSKKAIESAKAATETAKGKFEDAQAAAKLVGDDPKASDLAKTLVESTKADYIAKRQAETKVRIKGAQVGEYLPDESERGLFHVTLDKPAFNPKDGKKLSKAYTQKFTIAEWNQFSKNSSGLGYEQTIVWNPTIYNL